MPKPDESRRASTGLARPSRFLPTPDASNAIIRIAGLTGEEWNMANAIYDQDRRLYAYLREAILGPGPWLLEE